MTRQGYLILHDKRDRPTVCYFSLEDGFLRQYANADCAKCLCEVRLSGCKIAVKAQKRTDGVPHSFYLETRKVFVKDRSYTLGNIMRMEFSACSGEDRQEWGKALFSWQRYYWRDPQASPEKESSANDTRLLLEQLIAKHYVDKSASGHALSFASAKHPLSVLRRNAHSLRRSLSLSNTSTVTNAAKPESDADPTDCVKEKMAMSKMTCAEAVKAHSTGKGAAVTPHYLPMRFGRGNNQEAH